jgi:hypothetical protein
MMDEQRRYGEEWVKLWPIFAAPPQSLFQFRMVFPRLPSNRARKGQRMAESRPAASPPAGGVVTRR